MKIPRPLRKAAIMRPMVKRTLWKSAILSLLAALVLIGPLLAQETNAAPEAIVIGDTNAAPTKSSQTNAEDATPSSTNDDQAMGDDFVPAGKEGINREAMVVFGRDAVLKSNDTAEVVVVIGGSAKIHGKVRDAVVVIGGDVEIDGQAKDVVAVLGSVKAGRGAKVRGDVVAVGGSLELAEGVTLQRKPVELDLGGLSIGLRKWMFHCLFKLRPLAPQVGWVWLVAGFFFLIYLIIALVLPGPVRVCAGELTRRPATTFFMGLLTKMLVPVVFVILVATGIGALVVPFIGAALAFGAMIGKVALFESLGFGVGRRFGLVSLQGSLMGFVAGILVITILYMVPVLGLVTLGVVSVWGLGGAVTAAFGALRRESPATPAAPAAIAPPETVGGSPNVGTIESAAPGTAPGAEGVKVAALPEALSYRRANFWERMGAGFLDFVLVGIVALFVHGPPPFGFLIALAYFSGMWAWKGTTLGAIVLSIKVVRLDGKPLTFLIALVRALAGAFSIVVFFLGFLWIGWDREKQGWHDKIAGTVVVRLPRSVPLVCL